MDVTHEDCSEHHTLPCNVSYVEVRSSDPFGQTGSMCVHKTFRLRVRLLRDGRKELKNLLGIRALAYVDADFFFCLRFSCS